MYYYQWVQRKNRKGQNLTKTNKCDNMELTKWLTLFTGDEEDMKELIKDENKEISESASFIFSWNKTEEEKYLAMKREETLIEKNSIRYDGELEGVEKTKKEIVKRMYLDNIPLNLIAKYSAKREKHTQKEYHYSDKYSGFYTCRGLLQEV